ncbi:unnamed protein product [Urochloa humidicola]
MAMAMAARLPPGRADPAHPICAGRPSGARGLSWERPSGARIRVGTRWWPDPRRQRLDLAFRCPDPASCSGNKEHSRPRHFAWLGARDKCSGLPALPWQLERGSTRPNTAVVPSGVRRADPDKDTVWELLAKANWIPIRRRRRRLRVPFSMEALSLQLLHHLGFSISTIYDAPC